MLKMMEVLSWIVFGMGCLIGLSGLLAVGFYAAVFLFSYPRELLPGLFLAMFALSLGSFPAWHLAIQRRLVSPYPLVISTGFVLLGAGIVATALASSEPLARP